MEQLILGHVYNEYLVFGMKTRYDTSTAPPWDAVPEGSGPYLRSKRYVVNLHGYDRQK
jgi:hypothetical protein